ncbi:phage virion morphogenesis protein [Desulfovibrio sp. SGI.169]|uniref:phage virion morphogenesis protein n=1 Tax=Desulfovibrio sp. SGI.169 TaxID=3420561 RepID=UPI003D000318
MAAKNGVSLNWGGFDKALSKAGRKLGDTQALMESVGEALRAGTLKRFEHEEDPTGKKWKSSARAAAKGGKTLDKEGHLKDSIDYSATPDKVMVGSNLPYARIHQLGGTIRAKKGKYLKFKGLNGEDVFVKEAKITARPYLGVSKEEMEEVRETMADFLAGAFKA